jgi:hypothetical protein
VRFASSSCRVAGMVPEVPQQRVQLHLRPRTSPISATSAANFTIIRGKRPPLDSVANPDEVRKALANSRHAWMLEEKDMFDRLKSTHAHSPPPRDP